MGRRRRSAEGSDASPIDLAAVSDFYDFDDAPRVIHSVENAIIPLPDSVERLAGELLATGRPTIVRQRLDGTNDAGSVGLLHPA